MTSSQPLRERLGANKILIAPGVYDALSALMAEQAGAEALYLSGAGISYSRLGRPDIGLVDMTEVTQVLAAISERVDLPVIVDGDTGYGNALNVRRTVRSFAGAGANAIQIEDQALPKRCGHLSGKTLVSTSEMSGKIKAACDARPSDSLLIVARTDAIAVEGFDAALERSGRYLDAGADVLFVEAPCSSEQMQRIVAVFGGRAPLMANMVEGGRTPMMSAGELQEMGFNLVIFPGGVVRATVKTMGEYFSSLLQHGGTAPFRARMADFTELNEIIGTPGMVATGRRYDAEPNGQ